MTCKVKIKFKPSEIMEKRGVNQGGKAWLFAGERFKLYSDEHIPFQSGALATSGHVSATANGSEVTWSSPYAHYQYTGLVMGPNTLTDDGWRSFVKPKHYTGGQLTYHGDDRGDHWDRKTMASSSGKLLQDVATYVGGKV